MTGFRTALFVVSLLSSGTLASADTCSDVDFRTMKVIEQVFSVPASELSPRAEYVGTLAITDGRKDRLLSALEKEFGLRANQIVRDPPWRRVQDTIAEMRRVTKCAG